MILLFLLLILFTVSLGILGSGTIVNTSHRTLLTIFPDQFKLVFERIEFRTQDGLTLKGWFIPAPTPSLRTVILLHGWGDNKGDILPATHFLCEKEELNLLYFDFRACGESAGKISSIGYLESFDFDAAIDFLKHHKNPLLSHLGVYGHSMGAAVALWGAAKYRMIRAVVSEASFASFNQTVAYYTHRKYRLPYYPFVSSILLGSRIRLGADSEPYSPIYHVDSISPAPILFLHGEKDTYTLPETTQILYQKAKEPKEIWIVPEATHGKCSEMGGEEYQKRIGSFYRKYL